MAEPSLKGFLKYWGGQLGGLKDMAVTAYNKNKYESIQPIRNPLVSPMTNRDTVTPTPTRQPTPSAYPTMGADFQFNVQDKPPIPANLIGMVNRAATEKGINPKVAAGLLAQETGGYNYDLKPEQRVGASGERGITQIIPKWHYKEAGYRSEEEYGQALDNGDEFAIKESARILKKYYTGRKNIFDALREYNAGGNLESGTQYAIRVLKRVGLDDEIPEEYRKSKSVANTL
jgi:hypothetical protein